MCTAAGITMLLGVELYEAAHVEWTWVAAGDCPLYRCRGSCQPAGTLASRHVSRRHVSCQARAVSARVVLCACLCACSCMQRLMGKRKANGELAALAASRANQRVGWLGWLGRCVGTRGRGTSWQGKLILRIAAMQK